MQARTVERRDEVASALFALWVVAGLFLDGWAHNADKAETFWTPWHAVLYSGFFTGAAYAAVQSWRARRDGRPLLSDPLIAAGMLTFLLGGMADAGWHSVFGVEEDLEALLSPTHLLLMIGGLLLTTSAVRTAWARPERAPWLRTLLPALVGTTLAIAVVAFFLQFSSPFRPEPEALLGAPGDTEVGLVVMGMIVTTVLLLGATFVLSARWTLPNHSVLFVYTGFALLMTGLHGYREIALLLPAALAGALADALLRQGAKPRTIGMVVPTVLWSAWFATYATAWGLDWTPDLWLGAIVFGAVTGVGVSYLTQPPQALRVFTAPAAEAPRRARAEEPVARR